MWIRRNVIETIGLFDEQFFMYYEDADYCSRAREAGFGIFGVPAARMWHKVSASSRHDPGKSSYWRARGQVLFYRKHTRGPAAAAAHLYVAGKTIFAVLRGELARRGASRPLLCGLRDGYRMALSEAPHA